MVWPRLKVFWFSKNNPTGIVKEKRKDRQKKRWEDNIKEWTGIDFASSTRAAENRTIWRGIVANLWFPTISKGFVREKNRVFLEMLL